MKKLATKKIISIINQSLVIVMILFLALTPLLTQAQPGFEGDTRDVPVDGGLSILVAAGGAYIWKKGRNKKP